MANVKISQLPVASTPLAGSEEIPLVQGGITKQVTVDGLLTSANLGTPSVINLTYATNVPVNEATGVLPVANGGTGAATAAAGIENLLPSYSGNANKRLGLNSGATGLEWVSDGGGTVTSVGMSVPSFLSISGSPITSSGTLAVSYSGTALPVLNGGTGTTTSTGTGSVVLSSSPTLVTPALGTPASGNFSTGSFTWPTFNQNTTGTAAGLSSTLAIGSGGTGQTTANAAFNALAPSQTGNSGKYLTTDGSNTSWATNPLGTVTSVSGTGTVNGLTLTGTVTTSGSLTLGGTLDLSSPPAIGGTAANTGAFTTLTTSSTVTLNGGTANGVTYLNGSKVLTSGSALNYATGTGVGNLLEVIGGSNNVNGQFNVQGTDGTNTSFVSLLSGLEPTNLPSLFFSNGLRFALATNKAASGYSEQMRLTSTGLGIGTSSPAVKLDVVVASGTATVKVGNGTVSGGALLNLQGASGAKTWFVGSNYNIAGGLEFTQSTANGGSTIGATPSMLLDTSGNLGIGTSAGKGKLSVKTASATAPATIAGSTWDATYSLFGIPDTATGACLGIGMVGGGLTAGYGTQLLSLAPSSDYLPINYYANLHVWYGGATERMRLDSSGNVGIGVTPSAWATFNKVMQAGGGVFASYNTDNNTMFGSNTYYNGGFKYISSDTATNYRQLVGQHQWFTAPSGNAGDPITFTQALTLDSSGKLSLGSTTAPSTHMMKIANSTQAGVLLSGANSVANDGSFTTEVANGTILIVTENNTGDGGLFFCGYASSTITLISDPNNKYATSITAGKICVTKSSYTGTVTITNKVGSTKSITVGKFSASD